MIYNKGDKMKSIDALYELFNNIKSDVDYGEMVKARNIVEKDLEILEMLKSIIYEETHKRIDNWLNNKLFAVVQIKVNTMYCIYLKTKCMCIKYN